MGFFKFSAPFAPIMGLVGHNGAGKSAMGVELVMRKALASGLPIFSNIELRPPEGVECHVLEGLRDLLKVRDGIVFWDDVSAVAPARLTMDSAPAIVMRMKSLRHYGCALVWTSPVLGDVDVQIRQVTQLIVSMKGLRSKEVPGELWPATTWTLGRVYDMRSPEVTDINKDTPRMGAGIRRIRSLPLDQYDSKAEIELKADHGLCMDCGLPRRREFCKGHAAARASVVGIAQSESSHLRSIPQPSESHSAGITSIASSMGTLVPAVQRPIALEPAPHTSGEDVPLREENQALDGLDGAR